MDDEECEPGTCVSRDIARALRMMRAAGGNPGDAILLFTDVMSEVWPEVQSRIERIPAVEDMH